MTARALRQKVQQRKGQNHLILDLAYGPKPGLIIQGLAAFAAARFLKRTTNPLSSTPQRAPPLFSIRAGFARVAAAKRAN